MYFSFPFVIIFSGLYLHKWVYFYKIILPTAWLTFEEWNILTYRLKFRFLHLCPLGKIWCLKRFLLSFVYVLYKSCIFNVVDCHHGLCKRWWSFFYFLVFCTLSCWRDVYGFRYNDIWLAYRIIYCVCGLILLFFFFSFIFLCRLTLSM